PARPEIAGTLRIAAVERQRERCFGKTIGRATFGLLPRQKVEAACAANRFGGVSAVEVMRAGGLQNVGVMRCKRHNVFECKRPFQVRARPFAGAESGGVRHALEESDFVKPAEV